MKFPANTKKTANSGGRGHPGVRGLFWPAFRRQNRRARDVEH